VRYQVLTAASMKMTAFWDIAPCSLAEIYRCSSAAHCLHHQDYTAQYPRRQSSDCAALLLFFRINSEVIDPSHIC
jgi:hypothetical protein